MNSQNAPEQEPRDFASFLLEQSHGSTHTELSTGLRDLVARVTDTGKKGSLTLTITVAPMKDNHAVMVVTDQIRLNLPEHVRDATIFWPDQAGNLHSSDPSQRSLFETITVDTRTGEIQEP